MLIVCGSPATHPPLGSTLGAGILHVLNEGTVYEVLTEPWCDNVTVSDLVAVGIPLNTKSAEIWFERAGERSH